GSNSPVSGSYRISVSKIAPTSVVPVAPPPNVTAGSRPAVSENVACVSVPPSRGCRSSPSPPDVELSSAPSAPESASSSPQPAATSSTTSDDSASRHQNVRDERPY